MRASPKGTADTEMLYKNAVLKNFAKFTEKHLCRALSFNNNAGLEKKRLRYRRFPVNFAKFSATALGASVVKWLRSNKKETLIFRVKGKLITKHFHSVQWSYTKALTSLGFMIISNC